MLYLFSFRYLISKNIYADFAQTLIICEMEGNMKIAAFLLTIRSSLAVPETRFSNWL